MNPSDADKLTEEAIIEAPESDYMNDAQLAFFKAKLLALHESTCARIDEAKQQMSTPMGFSDPSDRASCEEESSIALRIVEREQKLLPKIRQSLERIRLQTYGYCQETGEPIGVRRLLARPTAEFCAEVKSIKELQENHYGE